MREGTVTRRMASVFNELGSEFENQYSAMDFREVLDALWEAKSQRMEVLALLYTMLDACDVKYQKRQNNQYYEDLVKTIRFPSYFEIEDRMLRAMYDRYTHYLSPSDYMKRVVDKLSDPADGWEDASLRLRILKQFIKYGNYLSDMAEVGTDKGGNPVRIPKAGGRNFIESYLRRKLGHTPTPEEAADVLDEGIFDELDKVVDEAKEKGEKRVKAAEEAFCRWVQENFGIALGRDAVNLIANGQKWSKMERDMAAARQEAQLVDFARLWTVLLEDESLNSNVSALIEEVTAARKAKIGKKTDGRRPPLNKQEKAAAIRKAETGLVDYVGANMGLELQPEQLELVLMPQKLKKLARTEGMPTAAEFAQLWEELLADEVPEDGESTVAQLLEWSERYAAADAKQKSGAESCLSALKKAKKDAHKTRQEAVALEGKVGLLKIADDLAEGMFREGGATKRNLYLFAMVYDMTFYTHSDRQIDGDRDVEKLLFRDYYSNSLMRYLSEGFRERQAETPVDPVGVGINYKNFAEMVMLYYISQDMPAAQKIGGSTRMIQQIREAARGKTNSRLQENAPGTQFFRDRVRRNEDNPNVFCEDLFEYSEEEFRQYLLENYQCNTMVGDSYSVGVMELETEQNTAFRDYCELVENLRDFGEPLEYYNYGLWFSDVDAYGKLSYEDGGASSEQLEFFRALRESVNSREGISMGKGNESLADRMPDIDREKFCRFMELLTGVNRLLGKASPEQTSYQSYDEEYKERRKLKTKALFIDNPKRVTRASMITVYYYYYNALHEDDYYSTRKELGSVVNMKSFASFYRDFCKELDEYLDSAGYQTMSSKNIFDVLVAFSAFARYIIG